MEKRIITISREFGSGGRFIGEEVAKKLGIAYYDKDIIGQIAEQSGLSPEYIKENAELSPKKGLFAYAFAGRDITGKSIEDIVYEAQRKVILELAGKEPCVIVGRNADYILKDRDDVLNVFIHGDMPEKTQRIMGLYNVEEKEAGDDVVHMFLEQGCHDLFQLFRQRVSTQFRRVRETVHHQGDAALLQRFGDGFPTELN